MKNEGLGTNPVEQIPYPSQKKTDPDPQKVTICPMQRLPTWEWFQIVGDLLWYPVVQPDTMQPLIPDTNEHELIRYFKNNLSSKTFKTEMKLKLKFKELQTKKKPVQHKCVQHENNSFWELLT